ncbi:hypothetical protein G9A89_013624 [Geosiphon pyriformis]|nr:hypothetical protein G9A89_013624 [Geosiphon pyriformis]
MFSTTRQLEKRTGKYGTSRLEYLQELVNEYQDTKDLEAKQQVLANLANFAYDPINYPFLLQLNVVDLFLDALTEAEEKTVEFGLGGICNICLEKSAKEHIINNDGIPLIVDCLSSKNENILLSALSSLMFLITISSEADILTKTVHNRVQELSLSENRKFSNLANVFLQDYFEKQNYNKGEDGDHKSGSIYSEGNNTI